MDFVYRKAKLSDSERIAELFEEMLRTIYHTKDVEGYEDGYLDRFFSEVYRKLGYWDHADQGKRIRMIKELKKRRI